METYELERTLVGFWQSQCAPRTKKELERGRCNLHYVRPVQLETSNFSDKGDGVHVHQTISLTKNSLEDDLSFRC